MTEACDNQTLASVTAPSHSQEDITAEFVDDGDDVHFCKKCNKEFTQLDLYLEHKIQHDNYKMVYSRSGHDRRVIVPKLVQRKTKASSNATENVDGKENRQGLPKRGGRGRRKIPDVDQKFITEKTTYTCDKCSKTFNREAALRRHIKYDHENSDNEEEEEKVPEISKKEPESSERPYTCCICRNSFKEIAYLKNHMLTHSDARDYICTFDGCSDAFKTKGSLVRHMRRHTGERPFCCVMCNRRFTESGALTRHLKARTPCTAKSDSDLPCYGKRWDFTSSNVSTTGTTTDTVSNGLDVKSDAATTSQLTDTVNQYVQQPTETNPSESIDNAIDEPNSIQNSNPTISKSSSHSNEDNTKFRMSENFEAFKQTQCRVCEEEFSCLDSLRVHLRTHLADTRLRCDLCHFMTEDKKEFSRHILSQHKNELKGAEEALAPHATILDNDCYSVEGGDSNKTIQCQNAEIAVNQLLLLKDKNDEVLSEGEITSESGGMSDVQSGRPVYKCHVCPRTFRGSAYLKFHLRNHTGDRPFPCTMCNKTFTVKNGLDKHLDTHSEERNFKCGECGKLFKRIAHVREHIKIHSSVRPYQCIVCEKSFKTSNALKVHMRIHSDIMPYECRFCQRHFREKASLQRHIRLHTGERPFQCKYCKRRFTEHRTLNRHLKAKVPCVRHLNYPKQTSAEPNTTTTVTSSPTTDTDSVIATATASAASYPTVLAEFSSVVADTQQYIVSEGGDTETAEYVVLHTSEDIVQKVEIITDASMVEQRLLETANSNETASYVVVHANSQEDDLHMLSEHTMQSIIMPADTEIVHTEEDLEEGIVEEDGEPMEVQVTEEVEHGLQTVTLVGQTLSDESNEIHAIAMAPGEETVSVTTADTIQQAMLAANMVDTCTNEVEEQIELQTVEEAETMEITES